MTLKNMIISEYIRVKDGYANVTQLGIEIFRIKNGKNILIECEEQFFKKLNNCLTFTTLS